MATAQQPTISREIYIALTDQSKDLLYAALSSDQYAEMFGTTVSKADIIFSFIRLSIVLKGDIPGYDFFNFSAANPWTGVVLLLFLTSVGVSDGYDYYKKHKESLAEKEDLFKKIKEPNDNSLDEKYPSTKQKKKWDPTAFNNLFNEFLKDSEFRNKYNSVRLEEKKNTTYFVLELAQEEGSVRRNITNSWVVRKIIKPVWDFVGLSSYAYWMLFAGVSLFTGLSGVAYTIYGYSLLSALALGAVYLALELANSLKPKNVSANFKISRKQEQESQQDALELFRQTLELRLFNIKKAEFGYQANLTTDQLTTIENRTLNRTLKVDENYQEGVNSKALRTGFSKMIEGYVSAHFAAWIGTDILAKIWGITFDAFPLLEKIIGGVFVGCSLIYGAYNFILKRQDELTQAQKNPSGQEKATAAASASAASIQDLKEELGKKHKIIEDLEKSREKSSDKKNSFRDSLPEDLQSLLGPAPKPTVIQEYSPPALAFINGLLRGAFLARVLFVPNTVVPFLPFTIPILSNPVIVGLVIGFAVGMAVYTLYEHYKTEQEKKHQKNLRTFKALTHLIVLADCYIKTLENDNANKLNAQNTSTAQMSTAKMYAAGIKQEEKPNGTPLAPAQSPSQPSDAVTLEAINGAGPNVNVSNSPQPVPSVPPQPMVSCPS